MNELFTRMQYEPSILMFGNKYKRLNSTVLDYAWNCHNELRLIAFGSINE